MAESEQSADIYDRVYAAERPSCSSSRPPGGSAAPVPGFCPADFGIDVPEPRPAGVLNAAGAVAGYTIGNDMGSRSIEGQNPLYLPQAKTYRSSRALAVDRPGRADPAPYAPTIELTISRDGAVAWEGSATTSTLHRKIDDLAAWLLRENEFPAGDLVDRHQPGSRAAVHAPGGRQVPHHDLRDRGALVNPVVQGKAGLQSAGRRRFAGSSHLSRSSRTLSPAERMIRAQSRAWGAARRRQPAAQCPVNDLF